MYWNFISESALATWEFCFTSRLIRSWSIIFRSIAVFAESQSLLPASQSVLVTLGFCSTPWLTKSCFCSSPFLIESLPIILQPKFSSQPQSLFRAPVLVTLGFCSIPWLTKSSPIISQPKFSPQSQSSQQRYPFLSSTELFLSSDSIRDLL